MAKQRAFLHIGLPHSGGELVDSTLRRYAGTPTGLVDTKGRRVRLPARSEMEMFNAAVEMRRDHRVWGLRRKDVEGSWARLCRRAIKNKDTVMFSHHLLAGCPPEGIALMVDQLPGCQVHVVVTVGSPDPRAAIFPEDYDLTSVLERWTAAVHKPEHLHLIQVDPQRLTDAWHTFGEVLGIDTSELTLPTGPVPATDPQGYVTEPTCGSRFVIVGLGQCGCQASSSDVRVVTAFGSLPSASCWMETCSKTSRSECRAAIQTCWSTSAVSL